MNAASAPRSLGPTASTKPVQNRSSAAVAGHEPPSSAIVATIVESHLITETSGSQHGDVGKTAAGARGRRARRRQWLEIIIEAMDHRDSSVRGVEARVPLRVTLNPHSP